MDESAKSVSIPQFFLGRTYDRKRDIHLLYGGSSQSGIAPSAKVPAIFLFTGTAGQQFGYHDVESVDRNGVRTLRYTGEGQIGSMRFNKGNKAILEHSRDGRALHLFKSLGKGLGHQYLGEYVYASHEIEPRPDKHGVTRMAIIFQLVPIEQTAIIEELVDDESNKRPGRVTTLAEARALAIEAISSEISTSIELASRALYKRSKAVKDYVLMRAGGVCELCENPAPFEKKNGTPYLEPHHLTRLSDGGPDHPQHVGAICPACHREIHFGKNGAQKNSLLKHRVKLRELHLDALT